MRRYSRVRHSGALTTICLVCCLSILCVGCEASRDQKSEIREYPNKILSLREQLLLAAGEAKEPVYVFASVAPQVMATTSLIARDRVHCEVMYSEGNIATEQIATVVTVALQRGDITSRMERWFWRNGRWITEREAYEAMSR